MLLALPGLSLRNELKETNVAGGDGAILVRGVLFCLKPAWGEDERSPLRAPSWAPWVVGAG